MKSLLTASLLTLLLWSASAGPASAQFSLFKRPRAAPSQRVPELILMVKTDGEERKRIQAAEELREYDPKTYTEIVPVLVDVAQHDARPNVRSEALTSLSKLRPVTAAAGQTIEKAASADDNWRVRLHAKSVLVKYHLAGYSSAAPSDRTVPAQTTSRATTQEPPLADPLPRTTEPPLAVPQTSPQVSPQPAVPLTIPQVEPLPSVPPVFTPPQ